MHSICINYVVSGLREEDFARSGGLGEAIDVASNLNDKCGGFTGKSDMMPSCRGKCPNRVLTTFEEETEQVCSFQKFSQSNAYPFASGDLTIGAMGTSNFVDWLFSEQFICDLPNCRMSSRLQRLNLPFAPRHNLPKQFFLRPPTRTKLQKDVNGKPRLMLKR